jgi:perosamine synthetase
MKSKFYPVNKPKISSQDIFKLVKTARKQYISGDGLVVEEFEEEFSNFIGRKYGIAVSNGTAALQIAFECLELKKGDEVILPSFAIISCLAPILKLGLKPIFIDSDRMNWNMSVIDAINAINSKTKAILIVHTYGLCVNLKPLLEICESKSIFIIEDAAEVHGARYDGKLAGSFGDISTFSFYANKIVTTGEGGMILTNSKKIATKARSLRNLAFNPEKRFYHKELAGNFRLSSLQAALGVTQITNIESFLKKRKEIFNIYYNKLRNYASLQFQPEKDLLTENVYWVIGIKFSNKKIRTETANRLTAEGVQTRPFFYPLDKQPLLSEYGIKPKTKSPNALELYNCGLYLPTGNGYALREINKISNILKNILDQNNIT